MSSINSLYVIQQQCGANIWEWEESAVEGKLYESSTVYEKRLFSVAGLFMYSNRIAEKFGLPYYKVYSC